MEPELVILSLKRRLLIERILFALFAIVVIGCWAAGHFSDAKSLILIDGKPVACVPSRQDADSIINQIVRQVRSRTGCGGVEVGFRQDIRVARAPGEVHPVSRHRAMRAVERVLSPVVVRWAIIADGKPVVALPNREAAGEALDQAKIKFGKLVANLAEEPQFKQNVKVELAAVDPSILRGSAQEAVKFLFSKSVPISKDEVYTIRKGDVAETIASRHSLKVNQLWDLNPGFDLNHLQIGDRIRIRAMSAARPKLTVVVRDQSERVEKIPAPVLRVSSVRIPVGKTLELAPGSPGQRRVKVAAIYENGRKVGSEILEEQVLRQPVSRQIAVGIKRGSRF